MWMSIFVNGLLLSAVVIGVYIVSLLHFTGSYLKTDILEDEDMAEKLIAARTVAFVSLVFSENVRAYTSRSFDQPVWRNLFGNVHMQKAIFLAQLCLYSAVFLPGFSNLILKLDGLSIGLWGWLVALLGALGTLILCEAFKVVTHRQIQRQQVPLVNDECTDAPVVRKVSETFIPPV